MPTLDLALSPDQKQAHDAVVEWVRGHARGRGGKQVLTLGGYAGVGKTFLISRVVSTLRGLYQDLPIAFLTFTGKASVIVAQKLQAAGAVRDDEYCGTIHGLIYEPEFDDNGKLLRFVLVSKYNLREKLLVVDEASMVDEKLWADLCSYGIPILAVGDHGQLPPVKGELNLMSNPEIRLEKIHRQAADNPIVKVSMMIRETGRVPVGKYGDHVLKTPDESIVDRIADVQEAMIICGTNRTRCALNKRIRDRLGNYGAPRQGERVICLRNNREKGIFNGMTGQIVDIEPTDTTAPQYELALRAKMDAGFEYDGYALREQFGAERTKNDDVDMFTDLFDWAYAITCHKAQGSEAKRVIVFEECWWLKTEDLRRRWLYTAVTRASERLIIVGR